MPARIFPTSAALSSTGSGGVVLEVVGHACGEPGGRRAVRFQGPVEGGVGVELLAPRGVPDTLLLESARSRTGHEAVEGGPRVEPHLPVDGERGVGPLEGAHGRLGGGLERDGVGAGETAPDGKPAADTERVEFLVQFGDRGAVGGEAQRGVGRDAWAWLRRGVTGVKPGNRGHRAVRLQIAPGCPGVELRPRGGVEHRRRRQAVGGLERADRGLRPRAELGVDLELRCRPEHVQLLLGDADLLVDVAQPQGRPGGQGRGSATGCRRGRELAGRDEPGDGGVPRHLLQPQQPGW